MVDDEPSWVSVDPRATAREAGYLRGGIPTGIKDDAAPTPKPKVVVKEKPSPPLDIRPTGLAGQRITQSYADWLASRGLKATVGIAGQKVTPQYRAWLEKQKYVPTRPEPKPVYNIPVRGLKFDKKGEVIGGGPSQANIEHHKKRAALANLKVVYTSLQTPGKIQPGRMHQRGVDIFSVNIEEEIPHRAKRKPEKPLTESEKIRKEMAKREGIFEVYKPVKITTRLIPAAAFEPIAKRVITTPAAILPAKTVKAKTIKEELEDLRPPRVTITYPAPTPKPKKVEPVGFPLIEREKKIIPATEIGKFVSVEAEMELQRKILRMEQLQREAPLGKLKLPFFKTPLAETVGLGPQLGHDLQMLQAGLLMFAARGAAVAAKAPTRLLTKKPFTIKYTAQEMKTYGIKLKPTGKMTVTIPKGKWEKYEKKIMTTTIGKFVEKPVEEAFITAKIGKPKKELGYVPKYTELAWERTIVEPYKTLRIPKAVVGRKYEEIPYILPGQIYASIYKLPITKAPKPITPKTFQAALQELKPKTRLEYPSMYAEREPSGYIFGRAKPDKLVTFDYLRRQWGADVRRDVQMAFPTIKKVPTVGIRGFITGERAALLGREPPITRLLPPTRRPKPTYPEAAAMIKALERFGVKRMKLALYPPIERVPIREEIETTKKALERFGIKRKERLYVEVRAKEKLKPFIDTELKPELKTKTHIKIKEKKIPKLKSGLETKVEQLLKPREIGLITIPKKRTDLIFEIPPPTIDRRIRPPPPVVPPPPGDDDYLGITRRRRVRPKFGYFERKRPIVGAVEALLGKKKARKRKKPKKKKVIKKKRQKRKVRR